MCPPNSIIVCADDRLCNRQITSNDICGSREPLGFTEDVPRCRFSLAAVWNLWAQLKRDGHISRYHQVSCMLPVCSIGLPLGMICVQRCCAEVTTRLPLAFPNVLQLCRHEHVGRHAAGEGPGHVSGNPFGSLGQPGQRHC